MISADAQNSFSTHLNCVEIQPVPSLLAPYYDPYSYSLSLSLKLRQLQKSMKNGFT